jgi:hypothetical protein
MTTKNLARRLERLEAELAPPYNPQVVTILITSPGMPDEIKELRFDRPEYRRRPRPWLKRHHL